MSEYQYYEFQALDQPLTPARQKAVARLSSRVDPHPTRAVFTYNYSDFPGRPLDLLGKYYDAMFYIANWGGLQLAFRFPKAALKPERIEPYCLADYYLSYQETEEHIIVSIDNGEQDPFDYWVEGEGHLAGLLPLRDAILRGDDRLFYLAWLMGIHDEWELTDEAPEPPLPAGLKNLTAPLQAFVKLFPVDEIALAVAAQASPVRPLVPAASRRRDIAKLPAEEMEAWLLRLAEDELHLASKFNRRLAELAPASAPAAKTTARTVGDLRRQTEA